MSFKLHGAPLSTCTRRVALIAKERNVPYEVVTVNLQAAENKQPPHLQHQPFGKIPYITVRHFPLLIHMRYHLMCIFLSFRRIQQADGFELFESHAIARYIASLGSGPELIPTEPKAYAKFEQAASIEYSHFNPIASKIACEKLFKKYYGAETDEKRVEELVGQLEGKLDGYEAILNKQKYLAGNVRTFSSKHEIVDADAPLVCRTLPPQIYSICHTVAWPLSSSGTAILTSAPM